MRPAILKHLELLAATMLTIALGACSDSGSSRGDGNILTNPEPTVATGIAATVGSPTSVLVASIAFDAGGADSARITYHAAGGAVQHTPFYRTLSPDTIVVLGLLPNTAYSYAVETVTGGQIASSASSSFTTASLPPDLAPYRLARISGVQHHFTMTGVSVPGGGYAVVFDSTGAIVWYRDFSTAGVGVSNVLMQPNGHITTFLGNTSGWQPAPGSYAEMTAAGALVHTYQAAAGSYMDDHDILITGTGANQQAHYFTFTVRQTDLSSLGMGTNVTTAGHQIVRENATGDRAFTWDAWDHIALNEWVGDTSAKATRGNSTDFDHPNALTFDNAGNYVVSWRNLDQIMALDPNTGDVLWRLGGLKSDFAFVG
ncbi:MAG TPA: aryl-sulfate sulfotransferase, partial [Gemmatimonadaceae bacterium]|nr:aryl-sulfate sulfotransferase [Gemmatimonadaceae bacterium]